MTDSNVEGKFLKIAETSPGLFNLVESRMIEQIGRKVLEGGVIFVCGNGGSAAQASHFAAELMIRYKANGRPIPCINLAADQSVITACANDLGYEHVFSRQLDALAVAGADVLIALSTSGKSENVRRAVKLAEEHGILTFEPRSAQITLTEIQQEWQLAWLHQLADGLERMLR